MIPDIAIIISVNVGARLLNEYVLETLAGKNMDTWRLAIALTAIAVIAFFAVDVVQKSNDATQSILSGL